MRMPIIMLFLVVITIQIQAEVKHFITSDSVDLYITIKGKGTPCLYIHGGPGSGSYWAEKFAGDILESHFQMIYLDQRGVSRSSSPKNGDYSTGRMIKDFEEIRKFLGIKQWLTMGHSFGGILQMQYVQRHPESIAGMLMINCALNINEIEEPLRKAYEFLNEPEMKVYMNDSIPKMERISKLYGRLREKNLFWKMGYALKSNEEKMSASFNDIPNWNKDYENASMSNAEDWINYKPLTAQLKMPVLFFYGKTDWMVGPNHYKGVNFPNMILWASNVGHVPFLENKEDLEKAIISYKEKFELYQTSIR